MAAKPNKAIGIHKILKSNRCPLIMFEKTAKGKIYVISNFDALTKLKSRNKVMMVLMLKIERPIRSPARRT